MDDAEARTEARSAPTLSSEPQKPVHTLVLDAAPLLRNTPPLSTLLAQCHALCTTPSILSEIRDPVARSRIDTLYLPFLILRTPKPESLAFVREFARKTGDKAVLSTVDLEILALAYELECERNSGDWRLRRAPGQKGVNGKPPVKELPSLESEVLVARNAGGEDAGSGAQDVQEHTSEDQAVDNITEDLQATKLDQQLVEETPETQALEQIAEKRPDAQPFKERAEGAQVGLSVHALDEATESSESDSEGWITPSNIKKHQARDAAPASTSSSSEPKQLQVATITQDFAMQNVLLQINLNLLSPTNLQRIRHIKTYILRCHGCFFTTKELTKQFCPRCGKPTLTRVACTTDANGDFKLHLKKNMQWNTRGNVFSIPKPVAGSANGKWKGGGGQRGWGSDLILAPDQKEYVKAMTEGERNDRREKGLMDMDYLPGILTGERRSGGGRVKVGAGRTVNSRRKR